MRAVSQVKRYNTPDHSYITQPPQIESSSSDDDFEIQLKPLVETRNDEPQQLDNDSSTDTIVEDTQSSDSSTDTIVEDTQSSDTIPYDDDNTDKEDHNNDYLFVPVKRRSAREKKAPKHFEMYKMA